MINVATLILKLSTSHFLDGDVPRSTSYGVYISQLIVLLEHLAMFNTHNKFVNSETS